VRSTQQRHAHAPSAVARSERAQSTSDDRLSVTAAAAAAAAVEQRGLGARGQATVVPRKLQRRALGPVQTSLQRLQPLPQCSPSLWHQSTAPAVRDV
jgi:hypothetical protein